MKKYVASLKNIADDTGFSITTISRVLQKKGEIGLETRKKVLASAEKLGYRPNLLINGMRTGKTKTIGVIMPVDEGFFSDIIRGIHDSLIQKDYVPILIWPSSDGNNEKEQIHRLIEHRVEGIIIRPMEDEAKKDHFNEIYERGIPVVTVDRQLTYVDFDYVGSDDYLGASMATRLLISLGHKRIGHLQGPQFASPAKLRRKGFEDSVAKSRGVSGIVSENELFTYDVSEASDFLRKNPDVTAVFAANDLAAASVFAAATGLGLKIPQDLSVIGYGNLTFGQWMNPSISTVNQFPYEIGENAVELLFKQISKKTEKKKLRTLLTKPELIVRQSTTKT